MIFVLPTLKVMFDQVSQICVYLIVSSVQLDVLFTVYDAQCDFFA